MNAISTIAMSIVSELACLGGASANALRASLADKSFKVGDADFETAISECFARALIGPSGDGLLVSILPIGWVVNKRDRVGDGWSGWIAINVRTGEKRPVTSFQGNEP